MVSAATSVDTATGDLVIAWTAPDDHGSSITEYKIEIRDKLASTWAADVACVGALASVVSARQCQVPMIPRITDSTYGYSLGDTIIVRVSAKNIKDGVLRHLRTHLEQKRRSFQRNQVQ